MRLFILMFVGVLSFANVGHACEKYLGKTLAPEDLRPKMIVEVQRLAPVLEADEIGETLELGFGKDDDFGLDDYLEYEGIRGTLVVHETSFLADNVVRITLINLDDLARTERGDFALKPGVRARTATYRFDLRDGSGARPRFKVVGHAEGEGPYYRTFKMVGATE